MASLTVKNGGWKVIRVSKNQIAMAADFDTSTGFSPQTIGIYDLKPSSADFPLSKGKVYRVKSAYIKQVPARRYNQITMDWTGDRVILISNEYQSPITELCIQFDLNLEIDFVSTFLRWQIRSVYTDDIVGTGLILEEVF